MAGRYVILEFDDSVKAERWVATRGEHLFDDDGQIIGSYYKPRIFCKCSDKTKQTAGNWARAKRYGIFICRRCRRPSIFHQRGLGKRLEYALGKNLLEAR